ncbi:Rhodanese-like domain-containing protein 8, chloroplastic [Linum grandiflorum]
MRLCNSSSFTSIAAIAAKSSAVSVTHNLLVHSEFLQFNFCCRANSSSSCFPLPEQRRRREANRRRWSSLRFASRIRCSLGRESSATQTQQLVPSDFIVVNFYRFVFIDDPQLEVSRHLHFVKDLDLHGRIYLNEQGINAQMEGGSSHLPLLDPSMRAEPLTPSEWRQRLEATSDRNHVLLDVRNGYEWDVGHFQGSQRPDVDSFRNCSFGLSDNEVAASDPLANVDKEKTDVLMYCTGGIRCDVYSTILRQQGFRNLYTLKGGVSHYLEREGPAGWNGNLFVFDDRLSLPPSAYNPETTLATENPHQTHHQNANPFARCYVCESEVSELRHRNCANPDCNFLFLCCESCVDNLRGCCCEKCTTGPRLRPVLPGAQRYMKWHVYRDSGPESLVVIESDKKKPIACPQA